jgi:hypothetical protein
MELRAHWPAQFLAALPAKQGKKIKEQATFCRVLTPASFLAARSRGAWRFMKASFSGLA